MIPLEDSFNDIVSKAMRGLGFTSETLAQAAGIDAGRIEKLCKGEFDANVAQAIAPHLELGPQALTAAGREPHQPAAVVIEGLQQYNTPFHDMMVNSYLIWKPGGSEAIAFDTGADCTGMLETLKNRQLKLVALFLTHTHGDHIFDFDRLRENTGAPAYVGHREPFDGAEAFEAGREFHVAGLAIETRLTWGHSLGGITYVVRGLAREVAVVGDAIFAGSMGGGSVSYADALHSNMEQIMTLPDETAICPGHGPMTSVGEERRHNPFFAA